MTLVIWSLSIGDLSIGDLCLYDNESDSREWALNYLGLQNSCLFQHEQSGISSDEIFRRGTFWRTTTF
jgi:hypothetical protein